MPHGSPAEHGLESAGPLGWGAYYIAAAIVTYGQLAVSQTSLSRRGWNAFKKEAGSEVFNSIIGLVHRYTAICNNYCLHE